MLSFKRDRPLDGKNNMYRLHTKGEVAKSLGNQTRGVQPACTMTTQNSKIRLISSIVL